MPSTRNRWLLNNQVKSIFSAHAQPHALFYVTTSLANFLHYESLISLELFAIEWEKGEERALRVDGRVLKDKSLV